MLAKRADGRCWQVLVGSDGRWQAGPACGRCAPWPLSAVKGTTEQLSAGCDTAKITPRLHVVSENACLHSSGSLIHLCSDMASLFKLLMFIYWFNVN